MSKTQVSRFKSSVDQERRHFYSEEIQPEVFLLLGNPVQLTPDEAAAMDEYQTEDETAFVVEEVSKIIKESVEAAIGGNAYQHSRVNQWTTSVVEQCLSQLSKLGKPFKYIVTCIIMQKNGAGLQTASACFWDNTTDGSCAVRWENKSMYCIVNVFGLSI
uniref:Dynein light chain Tctex-type 1 n=2 Tax=Dicentrarchus labrax TaxID=13489 RepID=A0A8C4GDC0_DICLA